MKLTLFKRIYLGSLIALGIALSSSPLVLAATTNTITQIPIPTPQAGSYGLQATKTQPPPTTGASINTPSSGSSSSASTVTVGGICPNGLLVEVFDNGVMEGAQVCTNGSFSIKVNLFNGQNNISAVVYDSLNQAGPTSNTITINASSPNLLSFGEQLTLTSTYGRLGVNPGDTLTWPLQIAGGTGPYAFSINWGDGSPVQLKSQLTNGTVNITHVYSNSGIYNVTVQAVDTDGATAFIQLVAVANGNTPSATSSTNDQNKLSGSATSSGTSDALLIPAILCLLFMVPSFALGRMSQNAAHSVHTKKKKEKKDKKEKDADT
jgi:hypothetical protein